MKYESIILELLQRIKKLEDETAVLKEDLSELKEAQVIGNMTVSVQTATPAENENGTSYQKMTDEMIEICYKYGKRMSMGENLADLADKVVEETGMNRNSAIMYLYAVDSMLRGVVYKRAINAKALKKYFELIRNEYGIMGLKKAIHATRLHVEYRREFGHMVDSIEKICDAYEEQC